MVFHWSLSVGNFPQVSRTLLNILAVLNNVVVWMVYTRPPTSKSSSPLHSTIFPALEQSLGICLSFHFLSVLTCCQPERQSPLLDRFSFFCWLSQDLVVLLRLSDSYVSQQPREFCASLFFGTDSGLCIYHLFVWSNLTFLHNPQWITFSAKSCLVLFSFCANSLHSLIM